MTTICAGEEFTAKGKVVLSEGWKAVERKMLEMCIRDRERDAMTQPKSDLAYLRSEKAKAEQQLRYYKHRENCLLYTSRCV